MNKPDFKLYADSILDRQELEIALRKIYDVGYRDGYMDIEQEQIEDAIIVDTDA